MLTLRKNIDEKVRRFDEAIKMAQSKKVAMRLIREKGRWRARNDLFYLAELTGQERIVQYPDIYKPFCDEVSLLTWQVVRLNVHKPPPPEELMPIEDVSDNIKEDFKYLQRLYLAYRTFYKTTIISKLHTLQLLLNFPNLHIIICHNTFNNSSANMVSVKEYFRSTEVGRIFPECVPQGKDWGNRFGFSLNNRTDKARDEENVMAVGVDTEITGGHWQIGKKNDLVTQDSINTEEQIKKTIDWDDRFNIGHFDDPEIKLQDYEGTRYHFAERYSTLKGNPHIKLTEIPILKDGDAENFSVSNIHNPDRFTPEGVKQMKSDNPWVFMCQMMLNPYAPGKMQFAEGMIAYYDSVPEDCNFYLLVDPASRRKKQSDFTVMKVVGIKIIEGKVMKFIADGLRDKLDPKQRVDEAMRLAKDWKIKGCAWEAIGFQDTDRFYFEERRRAERLYFDITAINAQDTSKNDRIKSLIPEYANHEWLWPNKGIIVKCRKFDGKEYDLTEEMELELKQWPLCAHDDLLDVDTFLKQVDVIPAKEVEPEEEKPMTMGDYSKANDERKAKEAGKTIVERLIESRV